MYPFVAASVGYGQNLSNKPVNNVRPFWGTNGPTVNISALIALKESYWGIACMLGYSAPGFDLSAYAPLNSDTNKTNTFGGGSAGHYNIYYLMGGLNLKLPQRTTRGALEVRFMVGPLICTLPAITYTTHIPQGPAYTSYKVYTTNVTSATSSTFAMSPGIGLGHKMSRHLAVMAYCDLIFASFKFNTVTSTNSYVSSETHSNISESVMSYVNFSATLSYSFGYIRPNIMYN